MIKDVILMFFGDKTVQTVVLGAIISIAVLIGVMDFIKKRW